MEASNDYQTINAKEKSYGSASIASNPIPSYTAQLSIPISYFYPVIGLRLRYKIQNSTFDEPNDKDLKHKFHRLYGKTAELVYQKTREFQTFLIYQQQDRLLLSMKDPDNLSLEEVTTDEIGYGFNWDPDKKPGLIGYKFGLGGWMSYVDFEKSKDPEIRVKNGIEVGAVLKMGYITKRRFGYWLRTHYSIGYYSGKTYQYNVHDLYVGVGITKFLGF
jgi:hypothetical protein